jgi:hypothetical protein
MAISIMFSSKSLYELDWIFFGCQVVKIHPPKNDGLEMEKKEKLS